MLYCLPNIFFATQLIIAENSRNSDMFQRKSWIFLHLRKNSKLLSIKIIAILELLRKASEICLEKTPNINLKTRKIGPFI